LVKRDWLGFLGYLSLIAFAVGAVLPSIYAVALAFTNAKLFGELFRFDGLSAFSRLFSDRGFLAAIVRTGIFALITSLLMTVIGCALAFSVSERRILKRVVAIAVFFPWLLSEASIAALYRWLFDPIGGPLSLGGFLATESGAFVAIIIVQLWRELALGFLVMTAGIETIPKDLVDASRVDGLSERSIFFRLKLPLVSRMIGLVFILSALRAVGEFGIIYLLTSGGPANATEMLSIYMFKRLLYHHDLSGAAAVGVLIMLAFISLGLLLNLWGFRRRWEKRGYLWR